MSLENFCCCSHDLKYQIEREVAEYLSYNENLNLKTANVKDYLEIDANSVKL
jgi:hypothetical protein